nr:mitochondrial pyruvate carrier 1-like isoform X1 [Tanacetum cinerariifolium]
MTYFRALLNSPVGPKTTHFWGPVSNLGFFLAGVADLQKPPEMLSGNMTGVLCVYSALFMRFAWMVNPRNHMLLTSHVLNESVQLYQLSRWAKHQGYFQLKEGLVDTRRPPEDISINMTGAMCTYNALQVRLMYMVQPRVFGSNCHVFILTVQLIQLSRWARGQG